MPIRPTKTGGWYISTCLIFYLFLFPSFFFQTLFTWMCTQMLCKCCCSIFISYINQRLHFLHSFCRHVAVCYLYTKLVNWIRNRNWSVKLIYYAGLIYIGLFAWIDCISFWENVPFFHSGTEEPRKIPAVIYILHVLFCSFNNFRCMWCLYLYSLSCVGQSTVPLPPGFSSSTNG